MPCNRRAVIAAAVAAAFGLAPPSPAGAEEPPVIAAAASLKFALEEIAAQFRADEGRELRLAFGSSGNVTRQIKQGAPFEMFLSADEESVFHLADAGRTVDRGIVYAVGRLALFAPHGSPLKVDAGMADLGGAVADGRVTRFAIANPEHAPYGRAAAEALRHQGLWEAVKPTLVLGENVAQAMQFATSGSAQGAIVPYSLSIAPQAQPLGTFALLPQAWHEPLRQRMVLLRGAGLTAKAFYAYVQQAPARAIFRRYGFVLPGEES
jgi:molybdate transport system substrate-binding protein